MKYYGWQFILTVALLLHTPSDSTGQDKQFELQGTYVEGCSCAMVCSCSLNGAMAKGCQVMGAMVIASGSYGGADISDVELAFAIGQGWVRVYVQSSDSTRADVAGKLGAALLSEYGTVESVSRAKIDLSGEEGDYTLSVNDGETLLLRTKPVLGADKETAVTYSNYPDPLLHTIMQGKTISGSYDDGKHHFALRDSNSFFNQKWNASGKI